MAVVAIIPARSGSKSVKNKNITLLGGIPLMVHSINYALKHQLVDRVVVSTDSIEYCNIATTHGAECPFLRPSELAADDSTDLDVFKHFVSKDNKIGNEDILVHLRPTTPFRKSEWLDRAYSILLKNDKVNSVRSVHEVTEHPYRMFSITDNKIMPFLKSDNKLEFYEIRRQDWPSLFFYNCVLDVTRVSTIKEKDLMTGDFIAPLVIPSHECIDIDDALDMERAKAMYKVCSEWV